MTAASTSTPCLASVAATQPMRSTLVSRSSRLKPRPLVRNSRTSSPSSTSTSPGQPVRRAPWRGSSCPRWAARSARRSSPAAPAAAADVGDGAVVTGSSREQRGRDGRLRGRLAEAARTGAAPAPGGTPCPTGRGNRPRSRRAAGRRGDVRPAAGRVTPRLSHRPPRTPLARSDPSGRRPHGWSRTHLHHPPCTTIDLRRTHARRARTGPVGARLPRAAQRQRAGQEGQRPADRQAADHRHLQQAGVRLDRRRRPARPDALVRPVHPARRRHPRRQDRRAGAARARGAVLHAPHPGRQRPAHLRAAAHHRRDQHDVRPRRGRHHRPAERPAALDPHRGRAGDLGAARRRRPRHHRGVRRLPARHRRLPARRRRARRGPRRAPTSSSRSATATSATPRSPTCPASSRRRSPAARCTAPTTRSTTSRSSASSSPTAARATTCGSAAACRPTPSWACASARSSSPSASPRSGRASRRSSATTATAARACTPG